MTSYSSKGQVVHLISHNRGKMDPPPPVSQTLNCLYVTLVDTFCLKRQHVTDACSTILFIYVIPIKKPIFQRIIIALVKVRRENVHVMANSIDIQTSLFHFVFEASHIFYLGIKTHDYPTT